MYLNLGIYLHTYMYFISHIRYCIVLFEFIIRIYFKLSFDIYCPIEWGVLCEGCQKNTRRLLMLLACAAQAQLGLLPRTLCYELSSFPFFIGCQGPQRRKFSSGIGKQLSFSCRWPLRFSRSPKVFSFMTPWPRTSFHRPCGQPCDQSALQPWNFL